MATDTQRVQMDHQLIDDGLLPERYVTGRLDSAERTRFEAHFVDCPACLDRIEAAEGLAAGMMAATTVPAQVAPKRTDPARSRWAFRSRWAVAGVCAASLLAALWANTSRWRMEDEFASERRRGAEALTQVAAARTELEHERAARRDVEARLEAQRRPPVRVPMLTLLATRGADAPTLELPAVSQPLVFSTEREEPPRFSSYFVTIRSEAGTEVWLGDVRPSSRDAVVLALDSSHFALGKYVLTLEGEDTSGRKALVGRYFFQTVAPRH